MELFEPASCEADLCRPLLAYIQAKKTGKNPPPYVPKWDIAPLHELFEFASLLETAGFDARGALSWLSSLRSFPSLWCPEKKFDRREFPELEGSDACPSPLFDVALVQTPRLQAALTLEGKKTSLGVILVQDVEVRAFGPQGSDLHFGIDGKGSNGWVQTAPYPEIWMEMKHSVNQEGALGLEFRFVGVKPEEKLSLAFYVKAQSCKIGNEEFKPKSLRRFQGETKSVLFNKKVLIESSEPRRVELIPLAGEGCFWDSEFLLSYPLSSFTPQLFLTVS